MDEQSYDPNSTREGGEPQGFRKERPRYALEGRGEQADGSTEGNISEAGHQRLHPDSVEHPPRPAQNPVHSYNPGVHTIDAPLRFPND